MYWNILGEFDLMNSFFIGNVEIEKTAALAPMASVADKIISSYVQKSMGLHIL